MYTNYKIRVKHTRYIASLHRKSYQKYGAISKNDLMVEFGNNIMVFFVHNLV